jgi:hypothetical protein
MGSMLASAGGQRLTVARQKQRERNLPYTSTWCELAGNAHPNHRLLGRSHYQ